MRDFIPRFTTNLVMVLALLLPVWGNIAMALGMAEGRVLVICTGQGLTSVVMGPDGTPIEIAQSETDCVLTQAADLATKPLPEPARIVFLHSASLNIDKAPHLPPTALPPRPRAPPA